MAPDYIPTMVEMQKPPKIAENVRAIHQAGPHHYGRAADGVPLTRDSSLNRTRPESMSCDEYPFATTDQGASKTSAPDWGWTWVPGDEQDSQGGLIGGFYKRQRILDGKEGTGDKYWVAV